jgi:hypothetical protein
MNGVKKVN